LIYQWKAKELEKGNRIEIGEIKPSFCFLKTLNKKHWRPFVTLFDSSHLDQKQVDWFFQDVGFPKSVESFFAERKPVVISLR
jgi:hypothetical protein